ncbi:UNVERIFIED_CONTAM: hypothetical protein K2H54_004038, partial [Gekko kuhli]
MSQQFFPKNWDHFIHRADACLCREREEGILLSRGLAHAEHRTARPGEDNRKGLVMSKRNPGDCVNSGRKVVYFGGRVNNAM